MSEMDRDRVRRVNVLVEGAPAPFREAVEDAMRARDDAWLIDGPNIYVTVCSSEEAWTLVAERVQDPDVIVVAVVTELDVSHFGRALRLGVSGVVYADTSAALIASVVSGAMRGEVIIPNYVARMLASGPTDDSPSRRMTTNEIAVARAVADGRTVRDIAEQLSYTDRTIRRFLQNAMLKLDIRTRAELVRHVIDHGI